VLGCEEPELYQHPPQARHLSEVFRALASAGNQIMLTTHSAYFVSGEAFEEIRLVRRAVGSGKSYVTSTDFVGFADRVAKANGKKPDKPTVARAKLLAALRPETSELFFCKRLVLVEGIADRAYVSAALHLDGEWDTMRRAGMHIIPTEGKSSILQLLSIAQELAIPCFVIFDADGDETHPDRRKMHEQDNKALYAALALGGAEFPAAASWGAFHAIWPANIEAEVRACFSHEDWNRIANQARQRIDPGASLTKNPVFIGEILSIAWGEGKRPAVLCELIERLKTFCEQQ
jgi:putative ATP-dependent endonuclease of the OLD family